MEHLECCWLVDRLREQRYEFDLEVLLGPRASVFPDRAPPERHDDKSVVIYRARHPGIDETAEPGKE